MTEELDTTTSETTSNPFLDILARNWRSETSQKAQAALKWYLSLSEEERAEVNRLAEKRYERDVAARLRLSTLRHAGIDPEKTFVNYRPVTASQKATKAALARSAAQESPRSFYIHSPANKPEEKYGSGKTHLAQAYAIAWHDRGVRDIRFVYAPDLTAFLSKHRFDDLSEERINVLRRAGLLILDDLEKGDWEPGTPTYSSILSLMDFRCRTRLPMVVTSNVTLEMIGVRYGDNVESRLKCCRSLVVGGPDGRMV